MTKKRAELTAEEKKYWKTSLTEMQNAEGKLQEAQLAAQQAQIKFQGFAMMLQDKYGFSDEDELDPNGELI